VGVRKQRTNDGDERAGALEDELAPGGAKRDLTLGIAQSGFRTKLVLEQLGRTRAARDAEPEGAPRDWDALCRLEQMLRQRRVAVAELGLRSHAEQLDAG
jgi:hypothetical protein